MGNPSSINSTLRLNSLNEHSLQMNESTKFWTSYHWLLSALFVGVFILGYAFPDTWWGTHYLRFLDSETIIITALLVLACALIPSRLFADTYIRSGLRGNWMIPLVVSIVYGMLIQALPVEFGHYGDSIYFEDHLQKISSFDEKITDSIFGFSLDAWAGQKTVLAIVRWMSHGLQIKQLEAFRLMDLICGMSFAFLWSWHILRTRPSIMRYLTLLAAGLCSPFVFMFFGHAEIYAPTLLLILIWSIVILRFMEAPGLISSIAIWMVTAVAIKLHPISILLIPPTLILFVSKWLAKGTVNWKTVTWFIFIPILMIGFATYFFVFQDHVDDRNMRTLTLQYDHLFLPLIPPKPPLDKYHLFSWTHLFDIVNVALLSSPAAMFLFSGSIPKWILDGTIRKPEFIAIAIPLILYSLLLFAVNPLLSLPMDWDLFSIPVVFVLVLFSLESNEKSSQAFSTQKLHLGLLIAITSFSFVLMHRHRQPIADRLVSVGTHVYRTYYEWATDIYNQAFKISEKSDTELSKERELLIAKLSPCAQVGADIEFSRLLKDQGAFCIRNHQETEGLNLLTKALTYDPQNYNAGKLMVEGLYRINRFADAYLWSLKLLDFNDVEKESAIRISIHCALKSNLRAEAESQTQRFLMINPHDPTILEIRQLLQSGQSALEIADLFKSPG